MAYDPVYPGAIFGQPDRQNLIEVVDAEHVNALQDEITAIETELGVNPSSTFATVGEYLNALDVRTHAEWVNGSLTDDHSQYLLNSSGLLGDRPAASRDGKVYFATDETILYYDNGASWNPITIADHADLQNRTAADAHTQYLNRANDVVTNYREKGQVINTTGSSITLDLSLYNNFVINLSNSVSTVTLANVPAVGNEWIHFTVVINQTGAGGGFNLTWPSSFLWNESIIPPLARDFGAISMYTFVSFNAGSSWLGFLTGSNFA